MGTKQARDIVSDVNAFHEAVWTEALQVAERSQVPTAHRGFLARSKAIDVEGLYQLSQDRWGRWVHWQRAGCCLVDPRSLAHVLVTSQR
jgi:hypothetical protein